MMKSAVRSIDSTANRKIIRGLPASIRRKLPLAPQVVAFSGARQRNRPNSSVQPGLLSLQDLGVRTWLRSLLNHQEYHVIEYCR